MSHLSGINRYQTRIASLDEYVREDSTARIIDRFVEGLDLQELGFQNVQPKERGRYSYGPSCLTKLYLYGYESGTRSSRKLEDLTHINIEVMWLMDELAPDFKTIADFRKNNIEALGKLLLEFNSFAEYCGLFGKKAVALDGTKIRANNSKKKNYSKKKLQNNVDYHRERAKEYLEALETSDDIEEANELTRKIENAETRASANVEALNRLYENDEHELSITDPDARMMSNGHGSVEVAYNVQAAVDVESHLVVESNVINNPSEHGQLEEMSKKTQEALRKREITVLADKGYYGHEDFEACENLGVTAVVARHQVPGEKAQGKYSISKFLYEKDTDKYICPEGQNLPARSHSKTKRRRFYNKDACLNCPVRNQCLRGKEKFKMIIRQPYRDTLDKFERIYKDNEVLYKLRQQTVEHVFGTVKRTMNGYYFLLRSKEKVKAETSLMFLGYNLKRTKTILGSKEMMTKLEEYFGWLSEKTTVCFLRQVLFSLWKQLRPTYC